MKDIDKLKDLASFLEEQIKKLEAEKPKEVNSYDDAFNLLLPSQCNGVEVDVDKFRKRLTIAKALGSRPFISNEANWCAEQEGPINRIEDHYHSRSESANYFPTKEQAEKYLAVCLKENLL